MGEGRVGEGREGEGREGEGRGAKGRLESDKAREKLSRVIRGGRGLGRERVDRAEPEEEEEFFLSLKMGCLVSESI